MSRNKLLFTVLSILCITLAISDIAFGSVAIPMKSVFEALLHPHHNGLYSDIIMQFRLPKAITAILTGAALSVAGLLMQTFFRNPLAGPDVLGVTSGASMGVALYVMAASWFSAAWIESRWGLILAAVAGALLVLLLILGVAARLKQTVTLLIIGLMFSGIVGAVVSILQNLSNPDAVKLFVVWTFGSLSAVTWYQLQILIPIIVLGLLITLTLQKKLNAMLLGEHYAQGLGVSVRSTRLVMIALTGILAGATTAFTGPIAFIGVAVPHLARALFQTSNHRIITPGTLLCGVALLLICDIISQQTAYPLPLNAISALFGAPLIIWVVLKQRS
ncbi:FecCD family ABC transporter permease [Microbacter margulisiae]|uniref:Iron complex transport system permease protein n=1 Tax=Microbacter margulisiae TaxID=1350067 RepID=A0A7W5DR29_9PORP|nr:iron ABC transporter permease [Microbacter margulisiae]MBB3187411.1 iron complex transport system permease protein [Microbacter margulisiae]